MGLVSNDHFVQAWGHLVEKLQNEPNIIGYDHIMNEPFIGSDALQVNEKCLPSLQKFDSARFGQVDMESGAAAAAIRRVVAAQPVV